MTYFSEKEQNPVARTKEDIPQNAWEGIVAHIKSLILNGGFAKNFPNNNCPDENSITCTNKELFISALKSEIPNAPKNPLQTKIVKDYHGF